jgi:hypothetical protein
LPHAELCAFLPPDLRANMQGRRDAMAERPDDWWDDDRVLRCDAEWTTYQNGVNQYLREHGWRLLYCGEDVPAGFAMAYGPASRGFDHSVVVWNGTLWHDPHASREGLLEAQGYEVLVPLVASPAMSHAKAAG